MKHLYLLLSLIMLLGCASVNVPYPQIKKQTKEIKSDAIEVFRIAIHTAMEWQWNVSLSDSGARVFEAQTPGGDSRLIDHVNVFVSEKKGISVLTVISSNGKDSNTRYINMYLEEVEDRVLLNDY